MGTEMAISGIVPFEIQSGKNYEYKGRFIPKMGNDNLQDSQKFP